MGELCTSVELFYFWDKAYIIDGFINWLGCISTCYQALLIYLNSAIFLSGNCRIIVYTHKNVFRPLTSLECHNDLVTYEEGGCIPAGRLRVLACSEVLTLVSLSSEQSPCRHTLLTATAAEESTACGLRELTPSVCRLTISLLLGIWK